VHLPLRVPSHEAVVIERVDVALLGHQEAKAAARAVLVADAPGLVAQQLLDVGPVVSGWGRRCCCFFPLAAAATGGAAGLSSAQHTPRAAAKPSTQQRGACAPVEKLVVKPFGHTDSAGGVAVLNYDQVVGLLPFCAGVRGVGAASQSAVVRVSPPSTRQHTTTGE